MSRTTYLPFELFLRRRNATKESLEVAFKMASVGITFTVGALSLAGLCTLWLVLATHRATLRQVNANLAVIAEQLKELRHERARPAAGSAGGS